MIPDGASQLDQEEKATIGTNPKSKKKRERSKKKEKQSKKKKRESKKGEQEKEKKQQQKKNGDVDVDVGGQRSKYSAKKGVEVCKK